MNAGFLIDNSNTAAGARTAALTPNATIHTKATGWTEVIASTAFDAVALYVSVGFHSYGVANRNYFVDIAIGAGGSESIIIADIFHCNGVLGSGFGTDGLFYVQVPRGSRLSARASCSAASAIATRCSIGLIAANRWTASPCGPVVTYGAVVSTSRGLPVVAGNAVEGAWAEISAATTFDHRALLIMFGKDPADTANTARDAAIDIGVGAGGSEIVIMDDLVFSTDSGFDIPSLRTIGPIPLQIPKGTRLAIRYMSNAAAPDSDIVVYGMG